MTCKKINAKQAGKQDNSQNGQKLVGQMKETKLAGITG